MELRIRTLGGLEIKKGETAVSGFVSRKADALFVYLACLRRSVARNTLATLLWDDLPQDRSLANLSVLLNSLRKQLDPFLYISRHEIAFNAQSDYWLDVMEFEERLTAVRRQLQRGQMTTQTAVSQLTEVAQLYNGEFLAGFAIKEARGFDEWLFLERERLGRLAIEALDSLVQYALEGREYRTGIEYANRLLQLDPLQEAAHRQKMRLLMQSGQRYAALEQFETCSRILKNELGVEPDEETVALYEAIKNDKVMDDSKITLSSLHLQPKVAITLSSTHNLPGQATPFIGREDELAQMRERLNNPSCRLLTVIGPGGVGKTRLALQTAHEQVGKFPNGVWLVHLAGVGSAEFLISAVATALNFSFSGSVDPKNQLLRYLRDKTLLLLLDNFEHLIEEAEFLGEILYQAKGVKLLVTSRERLNLQAEWLLLLEGLPCPTPQIPLSKVIHYDAVELFLQRAQQADHMFVLTAEIHLPVVHICQLVGGLPLGIELAAASTRHYTCAEIAASLAQNLDFLTTNLRDIPARHRSLMAVFEHSWQLLTPIEQQIFSTLSIFRSSFNQAAAWQVAEAAPSVLASLLDKSLLKRDEKGRYQLHELVRQYAALHLQQTSPLAEVIHDRYAVYYASLLHTYQADLIGPRHEAALTAVETDIENIRAAWDWAVAHRQTGYLSQMTECISYFLEGRGYLREGEALYRQTIAGLEPEFGRSIPRTPSTQRLLAKLYTWQGSFNEQTARPDAGIQQLQTALQLLEDPLLAGEDVREEKAFILWNLGYCVVDSQGDIYKAIKVCEQSLYLWQTVENDSGIASALRGLAGMYYELGDYDRSVELVRQSLVLAQEAGYRKSIANSMAVLGLILTYLGQLDEGEALLQKSVAIFREIQNWEGVAYQSLNLGVAFTLAGQFAEARQPWQEALTITQELGIRDDEAHLNVLLGYAAMYLGEYEQARQYGRKGLELTAGNFQRVMGLSHLLLGSVALAEGSYEEAYALLEKSVANYRTYPRRDELAWALGTLAYVARRLGNAVQKDLFLREATQLVVEIRPFAAQMVILPIHALVMADKGQIEQAVELYALAERHKFVSQSRWFADVVEPEMIDFMTKLPPEVVSQARLQGQAFDVTQTLQLLLEPVKTSLSC